MKKVGDLFEELGFRKDGSESVKRAFVENLMKAAGQTPVAAAAVKPAPKTPPAKKAAQKEEQLSFNFETAEDGSPEAPFPNGKRNAG